MIFVWAINNLWSSILSHTIDVAMMMIGTNIFASIISFIYPFCRNLLHRAPFYLNKCQTTIRIIAHMLLIGMLWTAAFDCRKILIFFFWMENEMNNTLNMCVCVCVSFSFRILICIQIHTHYVWFMLNQLFPNSIRIFRHWTARIL